MALTESRGYHIDWELKAFALLCVFALLKFLGATYDSFIFCFLARAVFVANHLVFLYLFQITRTDIDRSLGPSDSKKQSRAAIFNIFKGLAAKAVIVALVHVNFKMMPPLLVSCVMGWFSILENKEYLFILQRKFPALAETE